MPPQVSGALNKAHAIQIHIPHSFSEDNETSNEEYHTKKKYLRFYNVDNVENLSKLIYQVYSSQIPILTY